jgi:hypothetical protein
MENLKADLSDISLRLKDLCQDPNPLHIIPSPTRFWARKYRDLAHRSLLSAFLRASLRPLVHPLNKTGPARRVWFGHPLSRIFIA